LGKFISILKSIHLKYEINTLLLNFNTLKYQDLLFFFCRVKHQIYCKSNK